MHSVKIYNIKSSLGTGSTPDDIANLIRAVIEPKTWRALGGEGAIVPHAPDINTSVLVIRQEDGVHTRIEQLLQDLP